MTSQGPEQGFNSTIPGAVLDAWPSDAAQAVIEGIDVTQIKARLLELASLNGEPLEPTEGHPHTHYATNRLAFSPEDVRARHELVVPWMEEAGLQVMEHGLGVIGVMPGKDRKAAPLFVLSHVDTVPKGDMFDGTYGVVAAIEVAQSMKWAGIQPDIDVIVAAVTGEESARFGFPLIGSRGMLHGFTGSELAARDKEGKQLGEVLGPFVAEAAKRPLFGVGLQYPIPAAAIELHVEQASVLETKGVEVGLIEAIAAPERYRAVIGSHDLEPDDRLYTHQELFELKAAGKAGHSGTTPMSEAERADGLLVVADFLKDLLAEGSFGEGLLAIGDIHVEGGSINKIPGLTTAQLRIASDDRDNFKSGREALMAAIKELNATYELNHMSGQTGFDEPPLSLSSLSPQANIRFFKTAEIETRQLAAFDTIATVNEAALELADQGVVGTVGTYRTTETGRLELEIDIRGTELGSRNQLVGRLQRLAAVYDLNEIELGEPLAGSGEPVAMDGNLVALAAKALSGSGISTEIMPCLAGHDIQNVVRAGIPGLLMMCQSNNGGLAHNPEAYTADHNLLSGAQALASVITLLSTSTRLTLF